MYGLATEHAKSWPLKESHRIGVHLFGPFHIGDVLAKVDGRPENVRRFAASVRTSCEQYFDFLADLKM